MSTNEKLEKLAHEVIGAAIEVHSKLGPGYCENVYEEALAVELEIRNISFARQVVFSLEYKNHQVGEGRLDILIDDCLIVELKAVESLAPVHLAQVMSYLKITDRSLALLINFNVRTLKEGIKRVIL